MITEKNPLERLYFESNHFTRGRNKAHPHAIAEIDRERGIGVRHRDVKHIALPAILEPEQARIRESGLLARHSPRFWINHGHSNTSVCFGPGTANAETNAPVIRPVNLFRL